MQQTVRLGFRRKDIAVMKLVAFVKRSASIGWGVITPQLMYRANRRRMRRA
jgi:hypothetical protein